MNQIKSPGGGKGEVQRKWTRITTYSVNVSSRGNFVHTTTTEKGWIDMLVNYKPSRAYFKMRDREVRVIAAPVDREALLNHRKFKEYYSEQIIQPAIFHMLVKNMKT